MAVAVAVAVGAAAAEAAVAVAGELRWLAAALGKRARVSPGMRAGASVGKRVSTASGPMPPEASPSASAVLAVGGAARGEVASALSSGSSVSRCGAGEGGAGRGGEIERWGGGGGGGGRSCPGGSPGQLATSPGNLAASPGSLATSPGNLAASSGRKIRAISEAKAGASEMAAPCSAASTSCALKPRASHTPGARCGTTLPSRPATVDSRWRSTASRSSARASPRACASW